MRYAIAVLMAAGMALAQAPSGKGDNAKVAIEAKGYFTREAAMAALGVDPGENVVVVEVTVTPKGDEPFMLNNDEFLLRSDKDGQRATPLAPTQIAGSSVMVISSQGGTQGQVMSGNRRQPYGVPGIPGTGRTPQSLPMPNQGAGGAATADTSEARASIEEQKATKEQVKLLDVLKQKMLQDGEIKGPVTGLLYFSFEGKHKVKQYELVYSKWPPRASVRFIEPLKAK